MSILSSALPYPSFPALCRKDTTYPWNNRLRTHYFMVMMMAMMLMMLVMVKAMVMVMAKTMMVMVMTVLEDPICENVLQFLDVTTP